MGTNLGTHKGTFMGTLIGTVKECDHEIINNSRQM